MDDTYPFTSNWNSPTIRSEKLIHSFKMYSLQATQIIPVNQTLHCLYTCNLIRVLIRAQPINAFFYQYIYQARFETPRTGFARTRLFYIILLFLKSMQWQYRRYQSTLYIQAYYSTMYIELIRPDHIRTSNYNYDNAPSYWIQNAWIVLGSTALGQIA